MFTSKSNNQHYLEPVVYIPLSCGIKPFCKVYQKTLHHFENFTAKAFYYLAF
jgi:hypothetical protein